MSKYSPQVAEIHKDTFIGAPTAQDLGKYSLVTANADGDVTFLFPSGNKVIPMLQGATVTTDDTCTGVTSLISVTMT